MPTDGEVGRLVDEVQELVELARSSLPNALAPGRPERLVDQPCVAPEAHDRLAVDRVGDPYAGHRTAIRAHIAGPGAEPIRGTASLVARLLAPFQAQVNETAIDDWSNGKAKSLLKYLLVKRASPAPREKLMELFWPDAEPEAARNSLNVAVHRMRRALARGDPAFPFVVLREGCYFFNPRLRVWTDTDAFTMHFERGRELERRGRQAEAMSELAACDSLYQNELLAEDHESAWLLPLRQHFRDRYLTVLDRLSRHYFERNEYGPCMTLCTKMIAVDACHEAAHRRLMRCYAMLEQPQLAEGQYRTCVQTLARGVCVPPSAETTELYRRIARREAV